MADHIDAERAAPTLLPCPFCGSAAKVTSGTAKCTGLNCGAEIWTLHDEASARYWNRRTPSASIGEDGLPGLPKYKGPIDTYHDNGTVTSEDGYTADQMRQYALEAVAADRRARETAHLTDMAQWARDNGLNVPPQWAAAPPLSSEQQADKGDA